MAVKLPTEPLGRMMFVGPRRGRRNAGNGEELPLPPPSRRVALPGTRPGRNGCSAGEESPETAAGVGPRMAPANPRGSPAGCPRTAGGPEDAWDARLWSRDSCSKGCAAAAPAPSRPRSPFSTTLRLSSAVSPSSSRPAPVLATAAAASPSARSQTRSGPPPSRLVQTKRSLRMPLEVRWPLPQTRRPSPSGSTFHVAVCGSETKAVGAMVTRTAPPAVTS
mmetsp:Transcript_92559/g.257819  ORF Transcript_92559/g.257819 Transcript_92559/m.257819 type:complete len:221 (+) Transcript_92559:261-923(+)